MADAHWSDTALQPLIDALARNEPEALDRLFDRSMERLRCLTRNRLRSYPRVARYDQTDDVLQNVLVRLQDALKETKPTSVAGYFGLAAQHIRWELLDRHRHHYGKQGEGANHATDPKHLDRDGEIMPRIEAEADPATGPVALLEWAEFHEYVDQLPAEEKQFFDLILYDGMSRKEVANVLGISERMVKRRWREARLKLHEWAQKNAPSR